MVNTFGLAVVRAYMGYVQDNAKAAVRPAITRLSNGSYTLSWLMARR
ncbi:MAG: hypothetical protein ACSLEN_07060 [Candidatus Malihini olakiniferum]